MSHPPATDAPTTHLLPLDGGSIAYDDTGGDGRLVVCSPGVGDTRAEYRHLRPLLVEAGFRVVTVDLRGHGESDTSFGSWAVEAVGADLVALLDHLEADGAVLIGESLSAAAAVWAAAERPERVSHLVLAGPFVRDLPEPWYLPVVMPLMTAGAWVGYVRKVFGRPPSDNDAHLAAVKANLKEKGRMAAVKGMLKTSKAACEARLDDLRCPVLVLMGDADPDFDDPAAEARWIGERTGARVELLAGVGHYPQAEDPAATVRLIVEHAA